MFHNDTELVAEDEDAVSADKEFTININKDEYTLIKYKIISIPNYDEVLKIYIAFGVVAMEDGVSGYFVEKCFIVLEYNLDTIEDYGLPFDYHFGYSHYLSMKNRGLKSIKKTSF